MKVLIASVSCRELAQLAASAGYEVIGLDFFGGGDHLAGVQRYSLVRDLNSAPDLVNLAHYTLSFSKEVDAVVIGAGLENEPALRDLPVKARRWYNTAAAVDGVRDLRQVEAALAGSGVHLPQCIFPGEDLPLSGNWLVKDAGRSGGAGVHDWDGFSPIKPGQVLQAKVSGILGSVSFVADGRHARLVGSTLQFAGVREVNAPTYAWCGNVAPFPDSSITRKLAAAAEKLTAAFSLRGLNGFDFIQQKDHIDLLEVNPRPGSSIELFARQSGTNPFDLHAAGCEGQLQTMLPMSTGIYWGKGILYAARDFMVGQTVDWTKRGRSDIPYPGENIPAGIPVCTIYGCGATADDCWGRVLDQAAYLERELSRFS